MPVVVVSIKAPSDLDVTAEKAQTQNLYSYRMPNADKIRIVVADDHTIFRDSLCRMLAMEEDFEIVGQAGTGKQVMDVVTSEHPDILLLDLRMPDPDSLETLKQLRAKRLKTRIIVLTAVEEEKQYVQAVRSGARGVVVKQTATDLLIKSVRKVHEGEIWLDAKTAEAVVRAFTEAKGEVIEQHRPLPLSNREQEVAALAVQGFLNKEIAEKLYISEQTVKTRIFNLMFDIPTFQRLSASLFIGARAR